MMLVLVPIVLSLYITPGFCQVRLVAHLNQPKNVSLYSVNYCTYSATFHYCAFLADLNFFNISDQYLTIINKHLNVKQLLNRGFFISNPVQSLGLADVLSNESPRDISSFCGNSKIEALEMQNM